MKELVVLGWKNSYQSCKILQSTINTAGRTFIDSNGDDESLA